MRLSCRTVVTNRYLLHFHFKHSVSGGSGKKVLGQQVLTLLSSLPHSEFVSRQMYFNHLNILNLFSIFADVMYNGEMNEKIKLLYRLHIPPGKKY